jgi:branched-subunit amino acid ABC-type transport system permease component
MVEMENLRLGELSLRPDLIVVFVVSVISTAILLALLYRTRLGLATRAVGPAAGRGAVVRIQVVRVNAITFIITGLLGGIAGALVCSASARCRS